MPFGTKHVTIHPRGESPQNGAVWRCSSSWALLLTVAYNWTIKIHLGEGLTKNTAKEKESSWGRVHDGNPEIGRCGRITKQVANSLKRAVMQRSCLGRLTPKIVPLALAPWECLVLWRGQGTFLCQHSSFPEKITHKCSQCCKIGMSREQIAKILENGSGAL